MQNNIRTLSINSASDADEIEGLLYVPELEPSDPCTNISARYVPQNVTRRSDLPTNQYPYIALVPWVTPNCTKSYLAAAQGGAAMIVYLPDNRTMTPPLVNDPVWRLDDGGSWKSKNKYPVYAIPGSAGYIIMRQLSFYSGNSSSNGGSLLTADYNSNDYIRLYTAVSLASQSSLPSLWEFLLIVLGAILLLIGVTSVSMHCIQRKKRQNLRRRVTNGEVDLEALGIRRLTVPREALDKLSLFIYTAKEELPTNTDIKKPSLKVSEFPPNGITLPCPVQRPRSMSDPLQMSMMSTNSNVCEKPSPSSLVPHQLSYSQITCPICLDDFESNHSIVRELPCQHIFHNDCIDIFLTENSSLCPVCKSKVLPKGYCPEIITNNMVRRERQARRRQQQGASAGTDGRGVAVGGPNGEESLSGRTANFFRQLGRVRMSDRMRRRVSSAPAAPSMAELNNSATVLSNLPETGHSRPTANRSDWVRRRVSILVGNQQPTDAEDRDQSDRLPKCKLLLGVYSSLVDFPISFSYLLTNV